MTASTLRNQTLKDLGQLARRRGVNGWHSMRKDQLVRAIMRANAHKSNGSNDAKPAKKAAPPARQIAAAKNGSATHSSAAQSSVAPPAVRIRRDTPAQIAKKANISRRIEQAKLNLSRTKNLAFEELQGKSGPAAKDRLIMMVRGPYWLHAYWDLTPAGIARAQAALGQDWHRATPKLRLLEVTSGSATTTSERLVREIPIHGGVKNWYVDIEGQPRTYRLEIGYLTGGGRFYSLARSNVVSTPAAAAGDTLDAHWQDVLQDCDKIYAMSGGFATEGGNELQELFEERLHRPMGTPGGSRFEAGADSLVPRNHNLRFQVDAEMVIHGTTHADARVTLQGEPLKLRPDGTFSVRIDMPNRRQVIPLVACTKDGVEQRTIVLAVERNTKVMEPFTRGSGE